MFFGVSKICKLVPGSCRDSSGRVLELRAICWEGRSVTLMLKRMKMDQGGQGESILHSNKARDGQVLLGSCDGSLLTIYWFVQVLR